MLTRENARVASRLVNSITEIGITTVRLLEKTGIGFEDADRIVSVIQHVFKKNMDVKITTNSIYKPAESREVEEANVLEEIFDLAEIAPEISEEAAQIIQIAYKNFKQRKEKERELLSGMIDWRIAARSAIHLYRKTGVPKEEADRAATMIKAAYKGYFTRRVLKRLADTDAEEQEEEEIIEEEYEVFGSFEEILEESTDDKESLKKASGIVAAKGIMSEVFKRMEKMFDQKKIEERDSKQLSRIETEEVQKESTYNAEETAEEKIVEATKEEVEVEEVEEVVEVEEVQEKPVEDEPINGEMAIVEPAIGDQVDSEPVTEGEVKGENAEAEPIIEESNFPDEEAKLISSKEAIGPERDSSQHEVEPDLVVEENDPVEKVAQEESQTKAVVPDEETTTGAKTDRTDVTESTVAETTDGETTETEA